MVFFAEAYVRIPIGGPEPATIGVALLKWPPEAYEVGRDADFSLLFHLPLSREQITAIEDVRRGGKLQLNVQTMLAGAYLDVGQRGPVFRVVLERGLTIEKSRWVEEFLPTLGFGRYELWEVPFRQMKPAEPLVHEFTLLSRALSDYNAGEYEDVYKDCRALVESLQKRQDELGLESIVGREEWKRANHYLSVALHAEREIPRRIVRADAEFAIVLGRAILHRIHHAIERGEKGAYSLK